MNRRIMGVVGVAAALGLAATTLPGDAQAVTGKQAPHAPQLGSAGSAGTKPVTPTQSDNRPDLLAKRRSALQQKAVEDLTSGRAKTVGKGKNRVILMADGTTVDYPTSQTAQLLTFLVDFGDSADGVGHEGNPDFPDNVAGPVHNEIPQPSQDDNSTYWESPTDAVGGFSRQHYLDMFFNGLPDQDGESFHDIYDQMSSGRFDLQGGVSDWVTVPHPEAYYQTAVDDDDDPSTAPAGEESGQSMTDFLQDSADAWYDAQVAAGMTDDEIKDYLSTYDTEDRYDGTGGPDHYIDHFQAIHAGEGEEAGADPWTIWSHRGAVKPYDTTVGPAGHKHGGVEIGDTGYFIRDYTTEPENGGLGVFAHEFGHDLGLPDYYDTSGGDNGTGFWNLMSSGSWMSHGDGTAIGTTPVQMGATEKLFLGWYGSDLVTVNSTDPSQVVTLGPSYHATSVGAQAVKVDLPRGSAKVTVVKPEQGTHYFYSGNGDDRDARLTSPAFTVPAGTPELTARVNFSLEDDFDYSYVRISTDGGSTWTNLATSLSVDSDPNEANQGHGITGCSGTRDASGTCTTRWVDLTADLSAYAGQDAELQFQTVNDAGYHELGLAVDEIAVGTALKTDVEAGKGAWTLSHSAKTEWVVVNGSSYTKVYDQYYLAENRTYNGYDSTLEDGPYSFDYSQTANDIKVDHYGYDDGLLIWYANGLYDDNNTNHVVGHPGGGQALPVDANPKHVFWTRNGTPWIYGDGRTETADSTFDNDMTTGIHLTMEDPDGGSVKLKYNVASHPSVSLFDDSDPDQYWDDSDPLTSWYSTRVAGSGTSIRVLTHDKTTGRMTIRIAPVAPRATVRPTIRGAARIGTRLTIAQLWTIKPTLRYQWLANGAPIAGATAASFTPTLSQLGKALSVRVTATKAAHPSATSTSAAVRVQPAAVALSVKAPKKAKKGKRVVITVVASTTGLVPAGKVRISFDGRKVTKVLKHGRVKVRLLARHSGRRKAVVTYLPARGFTAARTTKVVRIR